MLKSWSIELGKTQSLSWRSPLEESDAQGSNFKARSATVKVWIESPEEAESTCLVPESEIDALYILQWDGMDMQLG